MNVEDRQTEDNLGVNSNFSFRLKEIEIQLH